ncbi:MAG TPA: hypothetical protein VGI22_29155, partial [Xanthobacteraceae bacterium]
GCNAEIHQRINNRSSEKLGASLLLPGGVKVGCGGSGDAIQSRDAVYAELTERTSIIALSKNDCARH